MQIHTALYDAEQRLILAASMRLQARITSYNVCYTKLLRFHQRAKREGYRSRAAYKLAEIQARERLLRPGQRVADLGCWPGGWLQVAARAVGRDGRVVGVDLAPLDEPLEEPNVAVLRAVV